MTKTDTGLWVWVPREPDTAMRRAAAERLQAIGKVWGVDFGGGWDIADEILDAALSAAPPRQWTDEDARRVLQAYLAHRLHSGCDSRDALRAALSTLGGVGT